MAVKRKPGPDPLGAYRAKRSLDRTPEPGAAAPVATPSAGGLFVVHMHAARRLHWDLRLEMDGVLRSWAVPKGPSPNRADKRLAVLVEDHPLEYGDFEGIIPEGNYGAGAVIVWDRGRWVPLEDPHDGMQKGKLLFELHGYKLKGKWTLVKLKKGEKEWLLIKEKDGYAATDGALPPESVLSGLTVEELKAGKDRAAPLEKARTRLKAPRGASSDCRAAVRCPGRGRRGAPRWRLPPWSTCAIWSGSEATISDHCRSRNERPSSSRSCRGWGRSSISRTSRKMARRCTSRS